jgi:GNAT superfamily N-acetyltransferase
LDGQVAGAAFARLFTDDHHGHGYLDDHTPELGVAVAEEFSGRGVGRQLMRALEDEARRNQIGALALSVNNPNPAKQLYERLGYRTVDNDGESSVMILDPVHPR